MKSEKNMVFSLGTIVGTPDEIAASCENVPTDCTLHLSDKTRKPANPWDSLVPTLMVKHQGLPILVLELALDKNGKPAVYASFAGYGSAKLAELASMIRRGVIFPPEWVEVWRAALPWVQADPADLLQMISKAMLDHPDRCGGMVATTPAKPVKPSKFEGLE